MTAEVKTGSKKGRPPRQTPEKTEEVRGYVARITLLTRWSQSDLADVMAITPQTITNWMSGRRQPDAFRMSQLKHMAIRIENNIRKRDKQVRRCAKEVSNATQLI